MQILWLGQSDDTNERIPEQFRSISVAATGFTESTALPVESEFRIVWPAPELPDLVQRWLVRYEPDMVVIHINAYWFTYESVPARVGRLLGPLGRQVSPLGLRAADSSFLSENLVFRALRRGVGRTIGGDVAIKAPECLALLEDVLRRVVAREDTVVVVRGPQRPHNACGTRAGHRRAYAACQLVSDGLEEVCDRLHVTYWKREISTWGYEKRDAMLGDRVHLAAEEHMDVGEKEAEWLVKAWQTAHPAERSNP